MSIPEKLILKNTMNWVLSWNKWMNHILNWYLPFLMNSPLFLSNLNTFWAIFGHFFYLTRINDSLIIELNYFFQLNQQNFLSWIIFWTESWANQYWIEYWITHFLAKFKHWIESDGVSNKAKQSSKIVWFFTEFWVKIFETFWNFQISF